MGDSARSALSCSLAEYGESPFLREGLHTKSEAEEALIYTTFLGKRISYNISDTINTKLV